MAPQPDPFAASAAHAVLAGAKVDVPPHFAGAPPHSDADLFEEMYARASGDASKIPWADLRPCPLLVEWLNTSACGLVRPGAPAAVVGAGLGDDVLELARRGYDVLGFDIARTAVHWGQRRHPEIADRLVVADLLAPPSRWLRRFDLVVEISTVQSVEPARRTAMCRSLGSLLSPRGVLLFICRRRDESQPLSDIACPPFPLTTGEVATLMDDAGLTEVCAGQCVTDREGQPRFVGVYGRP